MLISPVQYFLVHHSLQHYLGSDPDLFQGWTGTTQTEGPVRLTKKNAGVGNTSCHRPAQRFDQNFKKDQNGAQLRFLIATSFHDQSKKLQTSLEIYEAFGWLSRWSLKYKYIIFVSSNESLVRDLCHIPTLWEPKTTRFYITLITIRRNKIKT